MRFAVCCAAATVTGLFALAGPAPAEDYCMVRFMHFAGEDPADGLDARIAAAIEEACAPGQVLVFWEWDRYGKAADPEFAARYCDFTKQIVRDVKSVSCVYRPRSEGAAARVK